MTAPTLALPEAETAVLGCLMGLVATDAEPVMEMLTEEDFTDPRHRLIHGAIRAVLDTGAVQADPVLVLAELRRSGAERSFLADRAAAVYLADLLAAVPVYLSAGYYARAVIEHSARRRVIEAADRLHQLAGSDDLAHVEKVARAELFAVLGAFGRTRTAGAPG